MANIPTDLLRTLIALVDQRSFTRAARSLGITQPAVSAQVKRLQTMIGAELLDKSAPGVALTARGEIVVSYARRMLSLNDQMLDVSTRNGPPRMRIGVPIDYFEGPVLHVLARFRSENPDLRLQIQAEPSEPLLRDFRRGDYDLILAASDEEPPAPARRCWQEPSAWAAASPSVLPAEGRIPLVVLRETSLSRRLSVSALERAGLQYDTVYVGGSFAGLVRATAAGLGVACWARRCLVGAGLHIIESGSRLPPVPDVLAGVHLRDDHPHPLLQRLADDIAAAVQAATGDHAEAAAAAG